MPLASVSRHRPLEYSMLHEPQPYGAIIGLFRGEAIRECVLDEWGRSYDYAGVAPRRWNGEFDDDALAPGEFIVEPGLVYRLRGATHSSRS